MADWRKKLRMEVVGHFRSAVGVGAAVEVTHTVGAAVGLGPSVLTSHTDSRVVYSMERRWNRQTSRDLDERIRTPNFGRDTDLVPICSAPVILTAPTASYIMRDAHALGCHSHPVHITCVALKRREAITKPLRTTHTSGSTALGSRTGLHPYPAPKRRSIPPR